MANNAAAVAVKFPAAHVPDVARKLLLTAANRGRTAAVRRLLQSKPVLQHVDAATMEIMLADFIKGTDPDGFKLVCKVPAAIQLDSAAVARLLQAALQQSRLGFTELLLAFPATQQFGADMVVQLLHSLFKSITAQPDRITAKLCMLQAAQQLSSSVVEQLLLAAIERNGGSSCDTCTEALCGLPAARQLGSDSVARLLVAADAHRSMSCVSWLFQLPGLEQIDSAALEMLLKLAVLNDHTAHLLELPAAAQLSTDAMVRLLDSA
jgi:hypothetical protein